MLGVGWYIIKTCHVWQKKCIPRKKVENLLAAVPYLQGATRTLYIFQIIYYRVCITGHENGATSK